MQHRIATLLGLLGAGCASNGTPTPDAAVIPYGDSYDAAPAECGGEFECGAPDAASVPDAAITSPTPPAPPAPEECNEGTGLVTCSFAWVDTVRVGGAIFGWGQDTRLPSRREGYPIDCVRGDDPYMYIALGYDLAFTADGRGDTRYGHYGMTDVSYRFRFSGSATRNMAVTEGSGTVDHSASPECVNAGWARIDTEICELEQGDFNVEITWNGTWTSTGEPFEIACNRTFEFVR